jgi:hypothetical protein
MVTENYKSHNKQDIQRIPTEIIPARSRKVCCEVHKIINAT